LLLDGIRQFALTPIVSLYYFTAIVGKDFLDTARSLFQVNFEAWVEQNSNFVLIHTSTPLVTRRTPWHITSSVRCEARSWYKTYRFTRFSRLPCTALKDCTGDSLHARCGCKLS
jgi:hypothetical protein